MSDTRIMWLKLGVMSLLADVGVASLRLATAGACNLAVKLTKYYLNALFSISYISLGHFFGPQRLKVAWCFILVPLRIPLSRGGRKRRRRFSILPVQYKNSK